MRTLAPEIVLCQILSLALPTAFLPKLDYFRSFYPLFLGWVRTEKLLLNLTKER
jgi:hypothetical protein